jgi:arylsulfatase A-like enzyme
MMNPDQRPNFLIIQCDDLGVDDLGLNNPLVHTPNIDALAAGSVRFADFTVNPVCAPSRATFLTGRHFLRTGVSHVHGGKDFLHLNERTLADHFRAAGYATGMWGKWHSGFAEGYFPWQRGFDEAWVCQLYRHRDARGLLNGEEIENGKWADEAMVDYAIDFIRRHKERPFFAYLPTMTPHSPLDAPEGWVQFYRRQGHSEALSKLWGMVSFLDEQLGRILTDLEENGLAENTVVIFMSDNGPAINERELADEDRTKRKVAGLRGWKGDLYENGVRSPLFIRWPDRLTPHEIRVNTDSVDLAPTLLEMAGIAPVPEAPPMDGTSFLPYLASPEFESPPTVINYAHRGWLTSGPPYSLDGIPGEYKPVSPEEKAGLEFEKQSLSIRRGNFKLILNPDYRAEGADGLRFLVDLEKDPQERTNIAWQYPDVVTELEAQLHSWWEETKGLPHAFATPVFQLRSGANRIPARAPARLHGAVFNNVVELKGWASPDDFSAWNLMSPTSRPGGISIDWKGDPPEDLQWQIRIPQTQENAQAGAREQVTLVLPAGEFALELRVQIPHNNTIIPPMRALEIEL